jgi:hypothetical protein
MLALHRRCLACRSRMSSRAGCRCRPVSAALLLALIALQVPSSKRRHKALFSLWFGSACALCDMRSTWIIHACAAPFETGGGGTATEGGGGAATARPAARTPAPCPAPSLSCLPFLNEWTQSPKTHICRAENILYFLCSVLLNPGQFCTVVHSTTVLHDASQSITHLLKYAWKYELERACA